MNFFAPVLVKYMEHEPDLMTPITETPVERKTFLPTVIVQKQLY